LFALIANGIFWGDASVTSWTTATREPLFCPQSAPSWVDMHFEGELWKYGRGVQGGQAHKLSKNIWLVLFLVACACCCCGQQYAFWPGSLPLPLPSLSLPLHFSHSFVRVHANIFGSCTLLVVACTFAYLMFCLMQMYIISSVSIRMSVCVCLSLCVCSFLLFLLLRLLSRREMWKYFSINIYVAFYAWIVNAQAQMEQQMVNGFDHAYLSIFNNHGRYCLPLGVAKWL